MISLVLGSVALVSSSLFAGTPPPNAPIDVSGILDMEVSPEEALVSEGLPPTPESGNENPEDLLRSGPVLHPKKKSNAASTKGLPHHDDLPASLPLVPGTKAEPYVEPPLAPEVTTDIPAGDLPTAELENEPVPDALDEPPAELAAEPEPSESVAEASESGSSTRRWDRSIPLYDRENPSWAFDFHGSLQAFGTTLPSAQLDTNGNATGAIEQSDVRNFGLGFEFQPQFLQSIGVVSLGPSLNLYMLEPAGDLTSGSFSVMSAGVSVKYQFKYWRGQPIVPFVGFEGQMVKYKFERPELGSGTTMASGPTFGALLLLNWIEPSAAHALWAETGIRRSYLVAEVKTLTSTVDAISSDGAAVYFGLRLEY